MKELKQILKELNIIDVYYHPNYHDCYTFVFNEKANNKGDYLCLAVDRLGNWYHSECNFSQNSKNEHLGKRITIKKLPEKIKNAIRRYYNFNKKLKSIEEA